MPTGSLRWARLRLIELWRDAAKAGHPLDTPEHREATLTALRSLGANAGLVFGNPSMAQDQNAFAVTKAFADAHGITSLSELAATCGGGVTLGGPPECPQRAFCEPGLEKTYGIHVTEFTSLDAGGPQTKAALQQGKVAVGLVFSSDGSLASS